MAAVGKAVGGLQCDDKIANCVSSDCCAFASGMLTLGPIKTMMDTALPKCAAIIDFSKKCGGGNYSATSNETLCTDPVLECVTKAGAPRCTADDVAKYAPLTQTKKDAMMATCGLGCGMAMLDPVKVCGLRGKIG